MLVLSRKRLETIRIGNDIEVTVMRIGPNAVRLGITAPKDLNVVRDELPPHPIQASNDDLIDLGLRVIDPLGVAGAYDREVEAEMIDHGV